MQLRTHMDTQLRRERDKRLSLPVSTVSPHHTDPVHHIDAATHTTKYGMLPCR